MFVDLMQVFKTDSSKEVNFLFEEYRKMEAKVGIKETQEMLDLMHELAIFMIKRLRDGVDMGDAMAVLDLFLKDEDFRMKLKAAIEGASKIPSEMMDLDVNESMALAMGMISKVPMYIDAIKGK